MPISINNYLLINNIEVDNNLISNNIKKNISIFGITGNIQPKEYKLLPLTINYTHSNISFIRSSCFKLWTDLS